MNSINKLLVFILAVLLGGCQQEKEDLASYVVTIQSQQKPDIKPIPVMKPYEKFVYSAADLRDPFLPTVVELAVAEDEPLIPDNGIRPNTHRLKEVLESFALSELQFVGTLEKDGVSALIRASDGVIHRVQSGDYMGQNHGKVLSINETELTLKEIVPDGNDRYTERESFLSVADVN